MKPAPRNQILVGHVVDRLRSMRAGLVHCVVTSPPYWGLRAYGTPVQIWGGDPAHAHEWGDPVAVSKRSGSSDQSGKNGGLGNAGENGAASRGITRGAFCSCGAWRGELGLEPTPELYVQHIVEVFREVHRVLHPSGVVWLNLGDSYATGGGRVGEAPGGGEQGRAWLGGSGDLAVGPRTQPNRLKLPGLKQKDLIGIPWRVAFALQADGWYLRMDVIWSKPNPMPESTQNRPTRSHEYVFLLTKKPAYFYDNHAIKEPFAEASLGRYDLAAGRAQGQRDASLAAFGATTPTLKPERERERERDSTKPGKAASPAEERGSTTWS
jgi:DNA modification methylase